MKLNIINIFNSINRELKLKNIMTTQEDTPMFWLKKCGLYIYIYIYKRMRRGDDGQTYRASTFVGYWWIIQRRYTHDFKTESFISVKKESFSIFISFF